MKDHYTLATVSKKDMVHAFDINEDEAKLVHKYRKALPVITDVDGDEGFCVDASILQKQLGSKSRFRDWAKRIKNLHESDFSEFLRESKGGRPEVGFMLTVEGAKQVAMMEKSEVGYTVRKYFVLCEKLVYRMAKRNPVRNNCKLSTKMMAGNIAGRVPANKLPAMMMDMNAFICVVATGARPSAWKKNIGVSNVRDFLKENSSSSELRRYDEVAHMAEMLSRSNQQTQKSIKEHLKQSFGESEIYFTYLMNCGVVQYDK